MKSKNPSRKKQKNPSGLFITFEGTEGSGKSTQCRRLARSLRRQGYQVLETREPGGTPLAETIRTLLLTSPQSKKPMEPITPACETMLIFAARAQHMAHVIRPTLAKGTIVLCDRFFDSTLAYQGSARGLDHTFLIDAQQFVANGLHPHLTFFLDLPIQDGLARRQQSKKHDRLDQESLSFHRRVHRGFLALAKQYPQRIHKVDARQSPQDVASHIAAIVEKTFPKTTSRGVIHSSLRK